MRFCPPRSAATLLCIILAGCQPAAMSTPALPPHTNAFAGTNLCCREGRVLVWASRELTGDASRALWRRLGLRQTFAWQPQGAAWSYYELDVTPATPVSLLNAILAGKLPRRPDLEDLLTVLNGQPGIELAAPDVLILEWAESGVAALPSTASSLGEVRKGVSFVDQALRPLAGGVEAWGALPLEQRDKSAPLPDFEYYRECEPEGTDVSWDGALEQSAAFAAACRRVYGTGQSSALQSYLQRGSPPLAPVTVCVADTGVLLNHPDLAGRLASQAVDCNYRNYVVTDDRDRPTANERLARREDRRLAGYPRQAIKGRPAYHGTCVAGIVARCTAGFRDSSGADAVRILPVSVKSERVYAVTGWKVKSPISAFIKLIACLEQEFPVGQASAAGHSEGPVRVVNISAGIPRTMFSGREWRIVEPIVSKAEEAIRADLAMNDRLYVFAAGNERQPQPNRPGAMPEVLAVSACMPYGLQAWDSPLSTEGSNLGDKCVSAPGYGIITSTLFPCPNLAYLPEAEIPQARPNFSTPRRSEPWTWQTNRFSATSAATPQVSALAAVALAKDPGLEYRDLLSAVRDSTGPQDPGRLIQASWGQSNGLVDYRALLDW